MNVVYLLELAKKKFKALWDSGAGQCVLSFDCYNAIPARYKSDLFPSLIKIRAANGTIIDNKGECDITFRIGQTKFTFPFLWFSTSPILLPEINEQGLEWAKFCICLSR